MSAYCRANKSGVVAREAEELLGTEPSLAHMCIKYVEILYTFMRRMISSDAYTDYAVCTRDFLQHKLHACQDCVQ
jgi:hypothetical protein